MYIRKKILLLLSLTFSLSVLSSDIEEIIVKGEYREKSLGEEDSSIVVIQSEQIKSVLFDFKIKYLFFISLIFQVSLIVLLTFFSIYININSFVSYKNTMYKTAYGFSLSSIIDPNLNGNILIEDRNTRLYYPKNYIDVDKMKNCRLRNKDLGFDANDICLKKFDINQVISNMSYKANSNFFDCQIIKSFKASRNFFRQIEHSYKYCVKK